MSLTVSVPQVSTTVRTFLEPGGAVGASAPPRPKPRRAAVPLGVRVLREGFSRLGPSMPALAGRVAEHLFRTPPKYRGSEGERDALTFADPLEVRFGETVIRGGSFGEGPAIVLVHGWGGRGTQLRDLVEPIVNAGYRAVLFDGPGHGATGGHQSSLPEMAAAVGAVLDAVGPVRAVIAHSMGGPSVALALERARLPERLVFIAPPARLSGATRAFARALHLPEIVRRRLEARIEQRFLRKLEDFEVERCVSPLPLLVIHDRDDREVPFSDGVRVARAWPGAELVETRGLGHVRILRDRDVIAHAIDFVT
jgi:pimeloyl-ACP methyl ester carboxylesterase